MHFRIVIGITMRIIWRTGRRRTSKMWFLSGKANAELLAQLN